MFGGNYRDWYAKRMDIHAADTMSRYEKDELTESQREWLESSGFAELESLKALGMKPRHTLFEFGCGFLRSAFHIVDYLDPGNYMGNDASGARLEVGTKVMRQKGLLKKNPEIVVSTDNSMSWAKGRIFDYIWCHAVLCHVPSDDVEEILGNFRDVMNEDSILLVTFIDLRKSNDLRKNGVDDRPIKRMFAQTWEHTFDYYQPLADKFGYDMEDASDELVTHPRIADKTSLVKFTLKAT